MRPFEVGDLVVSKCGIGTIKRYHPVFELSPVFVEVQGYGTFWLKEHEIKTIRKPRKGSKEARDIVAMLCWLHIKGFWKAFRKKDKYLISSLLKKRKSGDICSDTLFSYQKAKSMLK